MADSLRRRKPWPKSHVVAKLSAVAPLTMPIRARQLAGMRLFAGLSAEALADVAATGRVQSLPKGTILFTQGTAADRCHAVIAGRMRISQAGMEGSQLIVRFIGPGEMFGTMALFTDGRYPLREAQERLRELATEQVDRRIAHMLLRLAGPGALQGNMDAAIAFPLTRQDIAAMCGATLYTASRILKTWERAGYVSTQHRRLTIHQLVEIRRIAEGHRSQKTQP